MKTTWTVNIEKYPKLAENVQADVVIVGGGLAGIWCFYLLSKSGKKVILLEKDRIGQAVTQYTTAFITQDIDTDLSDLVEMYGDAKTKLIWKSGAEAIEMIEKTAKEERIDCDFEQSSVYFYADASKEFRDLKEEAKLMEKYGSEVEVRNNKKLGFEHSGIVELKNQAKYHPLKFLKSIAEAGIAAGGKVFELSEVIKIEREGSIQVETKDGFIVEADDAVLCTYEPMGNPQGHFKKGMYTSYVYELSIPADAVHEGMYIDRKNPYHYFRVDKLNMSRARMIIGGEDHRAEIKFEDTQSYNALKEFMKNKFPHLDYTVEKRWSGDILEPSDGLALIGQTSPHQYVATAFSGNGMTYSALSAKIITDGILGKKNEYASVYNPMRPLKRKPLMTKAYDYIEEFVGGALKNLFKI